MASLYPHQPTIDAPEPDTTVVDLADDTAATVVGALTAETSRQLLSRLATEPAPASDLADDLDTTVQNVRYHLKNLREAGLIEEAGTWYSSRGQEMTVYASAIGQVTLEL